MSDYSLFKIPTAQLVGGTGSYGASLYVKLTPNSPLYFSIDGGVTFNATAPQSADIVLLSARMDAAEASITVLDSDVDGINTELSGLTARLNSAESAILGATASIQGLTARLTDLELAGTTIDQRLDAIEPVLNATTITVAGLVSDVAELQGLTARVNDLALAGGTVDDRLLTIETVMQDKAPMMAYVTDSASTNPTLALFGGTHYTYTQPLSGLTFSSIEDSHYESEVVFTADTAFPANNPVIPASITTGGSPTFEAGKSYIINVRDQLLFAAELTPGVSE